jgi:hypothetical protein
MFMSGAAHSATSAAAGGVGILASGVQYTNDGNLFVDAGVPVGFPPVGASQSGAVVKGRASAREGAFGFVGMFGAVEGVAFTANGGGHWTLNEVRDAPSQCRYGAFPSMNTWYVSGGTWPGKKAQDPSKDPRDFSVSEHFVVHYDNETLKATAEIISEASAEKDGYVAFISKTTDGGRTWTRVFYQTTNFYFNGIDCSDEFNCLVVAEGSEGAYLFGTVNGGTTWTQRLFIPGRAASLFDVKYVTSREIWACGGILDFSFTGQFFQSFDGGVNWVAHPMPGVYGTTLTFASVRGSYHGHATALTLDGQSSTLVYK